MSKKIKKIRFLNHGCYHGHTMISFGYGYDEIMVELKRMYGREKDKFWITGLMGDKELVDGGANFGLRRVIENTKTGESKELYYIIFTGDWKWEDFDYCKLAHECLHICQFFLKDVLDRNREIEAEAYFHTHLMSQALKCLRGK